MRDAKTSAPIAGATVIVENPSIFTITDAEGRYSLPDVPTGKRTLVVTMISYNNAASQIEVEGHLTGHDVSLEEDMTAIEEVTVKARMRSDTEGSMVATVRTAPQIVNGISAAQIAKSPDRNASEVVRRVPGITIIDDRLIIVRGLSQRYNNTWLNGLAAPGTETDSRAFPFDMIPGSQIDNLLVYKSPSPELPGDFSGGFVKITTKSLPEENSTAVSIQTGFNLATVRERFKINPGSGTDFLGFDGGKRHLGRDFPPHLSTVTDPVESARLARTEFNDDWRVRRVVPLPDLRLSFALSRRLRTRGGRTVGNITAINYSNTRKSTGGIANTRYGIYSAEADRPVRLNDYIDDQYSADVRLGAMHNWSLELNPGNRIEFRNLFNLMGRNRLTERRGTSETSGIYYQRQTEMLYSSRLTYTGQFSGRHELRDGGTITWDAGYSYANRNEPDRRIAVYQAGIGSAADIPTAELRIDNIKRYFQYLHDHMAAVSGDYTRPVRMGGVVASVRAGLYGEYRARNYTPREFVYRYDRLSWDERQHYLLLPLGEAMQSKYMSADGVYIDEITRKTDAYSANVYHGAAYGLIDIPLGKLSIHAGVRLEGNSTLLTYDRTNSADLYLITTDRVQELNLLPSANLTWKFSERHQLRAAYGRSVNRPELRELSPTVYYDFDLFSEIGGNPDLRTARIDNFEMRYEFYPNPGETVSFGVFYKHFKDPIEWTFIDMGGTLRYLYENARKAISWGFEFDARKRLDFIGLDNFSVLLNAAWIDSNVTFPAGELVPEPDRPMQGQSPYIVNAGLQFSAPRARLDVTLLYNRIGKRIVGLGKSNSIEYDVNMLIPDSYEMPRNSLDLTVSKKLGKRLEVRASVRDILSEDVVFKQFPRFVRDGAEHRREQTTRRFNPGQSVSVGITVKL